MTDIVQTLLDRAESYRLGGPSSEHTASLLEQAALEIKSLRREKSASLAWKPIETAPKIEFASYLGFDAGYADMGLSKEHALCVITWIDEDEEEEIPEGWQVQPLMEGMDVVFDDRTNITMWCEFSELLPKLS